jgi:GT2 family glycosyltransferase
MIVFLNYQRKEHTLLALQSIEGYDTFIVEKYGISAAINEGLKYYFEDKKLDFVIVCANDIVMPKGSIDALLHSAKTIPETGIAAVYCVESLPESKEVNGVMVHPSWGVFGNFIVTRKAFETVGYFNLDQDPYGMQDSDYCYRLSKSGFLNYYVSGFKADHIGHDVGNGTDYRKMKDDGLSVAGQKMSEWIKIYDKGFVYLPFEQSKNIIDNQQMYGE